MNDIGIIVLAAGGSSRMGQPKQLLRWGDSTLLRTTLDAALQTHCAAVIAVLGAQYERIKAEVPPSVHIVQNEQWQRGMHTSIASGVSALLRINPAVHAAILTIADQPLIAPSIFEALAGFYHLNSRPICAAAYANTLGTPALFDAQFFGELQALTSGGAQTMILKHRELVGEVAWPNGEFDIDTPEDYERLQAASHSGIGYLGIDLP